MLDNLSNLLNIRNHYIKIKMKLNTLAWTSWTLSAMLLASLTYNPIYLIILLACAATVARASGLHPLASIKAAVIFGTPLMLINAFFVHKGSHVLFEIPSHFLGLRLLLISGVVTLESVAAGLIFMLLLAVMLLAFNVFNHVTSPDAVIRLIPRRLANSALLVGVTFRFIPTLTADLHNISDAQKSRGLRLHSSSLLARARNHAALLLPTLTNSLERSIHLAEAIESRGYGGARSKYFKEEWSARDKVLTALYAGLAALVLALKFSGALTFWQAFNVEGLAAPPINPLLAAAALLYALPAIKSKKK